MMMVWLLRSRDSERKRELVALVMVPEVVRYSSPWYLTRFQRYEAFVHVRIYLPGV